MRDGEVGVAIAVGDPDGLAEAYDRYASALYTYCRSLLREAAAAAEAVQDTFVVAASELVGLRDRNRLRPWLYAVARNECLRRMGDPAARAAAPLDEVPAAADVSDGAKRAELAALLRSAVYGLGADEQDLIQLRWQQGLDVAEIAAILGLSRDHAHALLSRAHDRLEAALGTVLVARAGRYSCAGLSVLLQDGDGQLTVLMRKRINRHIRRCRRCAERRRRELAPALRLGLAPLAALPIAAPPARMRARVLKLASSNTPGAVAYRASVTGRTARLDGNGFPKPIDPPRPRWRPSRRRQAAAAAAIAVAASVAAATLLTLALSGGGSERHGPAAFGAGPTTSADTGASTVAVASPGSSGVSASARPTVSPNASPSAAAAGPPPNLGRATGGSPSGPRPSPTWLTSRPGTPAAPVRSATVTPTRRATVTITPRPEREALIVMPARITIPPFPGSYAALTLTASKGPVNWSITLSPSLIGDMIIVPSSGTLAAGARTTVTIDVGDLLAGGGQLTVEPGGITVTIAVDNYFGAPQSVQGN